MNYFQPYPVADDDGSRATSDFAVAVAPIVPSIAQALVESQAELLTLFVRTYNELRALPRGVRRALQHELARSREIAAILQRQLRRRAGRNLQRKLAYSLAGAALLLVLGHEVSNAATITVNTSSTKVAVDGKCSLNEAIRNANDDAATHPDCAAGNGADTIVLPKKSTHVFTYSYWAQTALQPIDSPITIVGNGAKITRSKTAPYFALMGVTRYGTLTLQNVTVSGGKSPGFFAGIYNSGTMNVENSTISGNTLVAPGVGYGKVGGILNYGELHVTNSIISGNIGFLGGGVYNTDGATATILHSTITNNTAGIESGAYGFRYGYGGGITNRYGNVVVESSVIARNIAGSGGGVANSSNLTIRNSTIDKNTAVSTSRYDGYSGGGGLVNNGGELVIENTTISGNVAKGVSPYARAIGGGLSTFGFDVTITNSTISGNTATSQLYKSLGGGIANIDTDNRGYTLTISNSTISGNRADSKEGGYGGGIYSTSKLIVEGSTLSNNTSSDRGGGIANSSTVNSLVELRHSLVSGNDAPSGSQIDSQGSVIADNFNLFGADGDAGVNGVVPGLTDIVPAAGTKVKKILGPLKRNGGPTVTHALVKGSPAVDAIPLADPGCGGTDQRGITRPRGPGCDIGAFER
jgi:hypothetical protein